MSKIILNDSNLIVPAENDDILTIIQKNKPHITIQGFNTVIQDKAMNGKYVTKTLHRATNRKLEIYNMITGYSIITYTNCKQVLIAHTEVVKSVIQKIQKQNLDVLNLRYGLVSDKMLGLLFLDENKPIDLIMGCYFTTKSAPLIGINRRQSSKKFKLDFYHEVNKYFSTIDIHHINKISTTSMLRLIAFQLTSTCGRPYGIFATLLNLIASNYTSNLSENDFHKSLIELSNPDIILSREEIVKTFKMEVFHE